MSRDLRPTKPRPAADDERPARPMRELADMLLAGGRKHVDVLVPRTDIAGRMRLLSRAEVAEVRRETRAHFEESGMPSDPTKLAAAGLLDEWNCEIAARSLAVAVRDPENEALPLADVDDWRDCDDDQVAALWERLQDLRDELDPLGKETKLSDADKAAIASAAKKGESASLTSYGSQKLALYIISLADQPAS